MVLHSNHNEKIKPHKGKQSNKMFRQDFPYLENGWGTKFLQLLVVICEMLDNVCDHAFRLDSQLVFILEVSS
jgi:hypothetical protein